jgi:hypothetical protein
MLTSAQLATIGHLTGGPVTDIPCRVCVRVRGMAATHTDKLCLRLPTCLVDVAAGRALTTRVARINSNERHPGKSGLVGEEGPELKERPAMQLDSLLTPNRYPFTDAAEFFDSNAAMGAFGESNNLLGKTMIYICGKAGFLARQIAELALGGPRASGLELGTQSTMSVAHVVDLGARVGRPIGIRSDRLDSHVDTEKGIDHHRFWIDCVTGRGKVELAAMVDQVTLALLRLKKFLLAVSSRVANSQPAASRPDAHIVHFVAENAGVVTDSSMLPKAPLALLIELVSVRNFGQDPDSNLGAQRKPLPGFGIQDFVEAVVAEDLTLPRLPTDPVGTRVRLLKGIEHGTALFWRRVQPDFSGELQYLNYNSGKTGKAYRFRDLAIPPSPKGEGLLARF